MTDIRKLKLSSSKLSYTNLIKGKAIYAEIDVLFFQDEGLEYAWCPALDIMAYGKGRKEAKDEFEYQINAYFDYTIKNNTLKDDLIKHGWKLDKDNKPVAPKFSHLFKTNKQIEQTFDKHNVAKVNTSITVPVFA